MEQQIIVNNQITLTPFLETDKPNLVRFLNDPVVYANTLKVPHPYGEKEAEDWLRLVQEIRNKLGQETNWSVRHRAEGVIGGIGRFAQTGLDGHADEIGYWLAAPFRGQGLMTAVVSTYCDWLFTHTRLVRIEAGVYTHNPASKRVLEKAGFEQEGIARKKICKDGRLLDLYLMARIKADGSR